MRQSARPPALSEAVSPSSLTPAPLVSGSKGVRAATIEQLRSRIRTVHRSADVQQTVPTNLAALDAILPGGGVPAGSVIEWINDTSGQGAVSVALRCLRALLTRSGCLAVVDHRHDFHAAEVESAGIPLSRMLLLRPQIFVGTPSLLRTVSAPRGHQERCSAFQMQEALWALEQCAGCSGVRVVLAWVDRCHSSVMRRLQLAVERSGSTVMLIRPSSALSQTSFADLRLHVSPADGGRREDRHAHTQNHVRTSTGQLSHADSVIPSTGDSAMEVHESQNQISEVVHNTTRIPRRFVVRILKSRHSPTAEGTAIV